MAFQRTKPEKYSGRADLEAPKKFSPEALAIHADGVKSLKVHKPSF